MIYLSLGFRCFTLLLHLFHLTGSPWSVFKRQSERWRLTSIVSRNPALATVKAQAPELPRCGVASNLGNEPWMHSQSFHHISSWDSSSCHLRHELCSIAKTCKDHGIQLVQAVRHMNSTCWTCRWFMLLSVIAEHRWGWHFSTVPVAPVPCRHTNSWSQAIELGYCQEY